MFENENGRWIDLMSDRSTDNDCIFRCFISEKSNKKYLFYWDIQGAEEQLSMVDNHIDDLKDFEFLPQDTYLILFTNIESAAEDKYKEIILVEENEFRYKKYVCYYTDEEIMDLKDNTTNVITNEIWSDSNLLDKSEAYNLLYRIIIKVPIIKMAFQKKELEEFDTIYQEIRESGKRITGNFTAEEIVSMEKVILPHIPEDVDMIKDQAGIFANNLIGKVFGDELDEYLSE